MPRATVWRGSQFVGAPFSLYNDTNYMGNCGRSAKFPPIDRKIMRYAEHGSRARRMMAKEYRHRAIVWGVQPQYCIDMLNWMIHCWGTASRRSTTWRGSMRT